MKRIAVISLLVVHLFNAGGCFFISEFFIYRSDLQISKQIYDNKIDSAKLIEIKVPVNLPGIADWAGYEKIDGQIQFKDAYYRYVRLKITHDTMSLICIPNDVKTRFTNANIIVAKQFSDVPLNNKKNHDQTSKKGSIDQEMNDYLVNQLSYELPKIAKQPDYGCIALLQNPYIESPGKPPDFTC